jgi:protein-L-isoaspartate(D-aspartate) O-methyltransferase
MGVLFLCITSWLLVFDGERDLNKSMRERMVKEQIAGRGVQAANVLEAMRRVPRHLFIPAEYQHAAYDDRPLAIGEQQTISQPYIVGRMTELAEVKPGDKILEIGTGSGYQAALLAELGAEVYSIEILPTLGTLAQANLEKAGYKNLHLRVGDGYVGWPEAAPFDAVVITAAPPAIPEPLKQQLKIGGRLVTPVGVGEQQQLWLVKRLGEKEFSSEALSRVLFVPMTGTAQNKNP